MDDSFDASFRNTMFHAAMAQRHAEMTYYLDTMPTQYCQDGKVYSTYLMHRGTQTCQLRSTVQKVGVYANVHVGIETARKIQNSAMPCPVCLRQSVEQSFADAILRSKQSPDKSFKRYVLGVALIQDRGNKSSKHILHLYGCPHYTRKGAVDFGYRTSINEFSDAVAAKYPGEVEYPNMQVCPHCFPDYVAKLYRDAGYVPPRQLHYLRQEMPDGTILCHQYDCPVCPDNAEDLGFIVSPEHAVKQLRIVNDVSNFKQCPHCMPEEEYSRIHQEAALEHKKQVDAFARKYFRK